VGGGDDDDEVLQGQRGREECAKNSQQLGSSWSKMFLQKANLLDTLFLGRSLHSVY